ncbi:MAG TPA: hypothetical protein VGC76_09620 [Pyrinomonadaceae bacterium]|jgi:hypothetical protein
MKINRKEWLKAVSALALGLMLAMTAVSVSAQRNRKMKSVGNFGGSAQLRKTARNSGYSEGVKAGRNDKRRNEPLNFKDERVYQDATNGYSARLGDKVLYQRYFREAFENGYRDGWNGY